jgi:site-specific recombinase XerD
MSGQQRQKSKASIREVQVSEKGYTYTAIMCRWREEGKDKRKRFKTIKEAQAFAGIKEVELGNDTAKLDNVITRLSPAQVHEAEAAFHALGEKYTLRQAVNFFLDHYSRSDFNITIVEAIRQFLVDKERDGVRERSIRQLESTLRQFEAFAYVESLDTGGKSAFASARAGLAKEKAASPDEIARSMTKKHRALWRKAAREVGDSESKAVPKILESCSKAVRNAAADARESIEVNRAPHQWEIVNLIRDKVDSVDLQEVTTPLIEAFLRSLRAKDGVSPASRKTWNNMRADIHYLCAWCGNAQRRWLGDNPASPIHKFKVSRGVPDSLTVAQSQALMQYVAEFEGGKMVQYFALALFAGLRTGEDGELHKLARHKDKAKLIDLQNEVIHIQPEISKTGQDRQVKIRPNLQRWLLDYPAEVLPANHSRLVKSVRAHFKLTHDVLRHTFFSMYISAFDSVGRAALEGGNTEGIIRHHYLNLASMDEGKQFWDIAPAKGKKIVNIA